MNQKNLNKRMVATILCCVILTGLLPTNGLAKEMHVRSPQNQILEKVDTNDKKFNSRTYARKAGDIMTEVPLYKDTDVVRVSVILDEKSTIEHGYEVEDLSTNSAAMLYRDNLKRVQDDLSASISKNILGGKKLDVVWNLTLAANLVSANVEYGQIDKIKAMRGVKNVILETRYLPAVYQREPAIPNMSTANSMVRAQAAWASNYTGAGSLIAIIDTGIDLEHQSFDSGAYEYAINKLEESGKNVELLRANDITDAWEYLNAAKLENSDLELAYRSSKIPFAVNYVDGDMNVSHTEDKQGEHGSHVAGIAAANRFIPDGNGGYKNALETVLTQGEAPDAQILVMKVFGKGGGAYDSDYMAAVEDALILGADVVNLSLGSSATGFVTTDKDEYASILNSLADSNVIWAGSAGNSGSWGDEAVINSMYGDGYLYSDDVGFATVGSPGTYANTMSVASVDNVGFTGAYLSVSGEMVFFTETDEYKNPPIASTLGAQTLPYIYLDNVGVSMTTIENDEGKEEEVVDCDYFTELANEVSFSGKIAMCNRGDSTFSTKANAAVAQGAAAVIICNNQEGTIAMNLSDYEGLVPVVSITMADAEMMKAFGEEHTWDSLLYGRVDCF